MSDLIKQLRENVRLKFSSGNGVPVDRAVITREEYEAITQSHEASDSDNEPLESQTARLATFIIEEIPGEPSQSQGAIDTASRWMRAALEADSKRRREVQS